MNATSKYKTYLRMKEKTNTKKKKKYKEYQFVKYPRKRYDNRELVRFDSGNLTLRLQAT